MKSSTLLALIRRLIDIWVDLQVEGWYKDSGRVFVIVEEWFDKFRTILLNERRAMEELPPVTEPSRPPRP